MLQMCNRENCSVRIFVYLKVAVLRVQTTTFLKFLYQPTLYRYILLLLLLQRLPCLVKLIVTVVSLRPR